ncbi:NAD(P)-dependent dehydrogenase (short-subunit alcohol dehydrogenase family) [Murinocardiopsis flavida]|uniref:NAD(P)-dependent dehydrogenase (Short-subunit alcohol dehydrogenase family) n=1 Tax=Murinocardiopsis flavida TaxID=645275 RepID=A0A2P8D6W5_9ACTN|nr:SDR family oxidoreductase [Murinocardiopsis flavida]PSK92937.1 NAD(P)-dependent dehydrogenase (short-subunit alcohol dehydrogenase family) [Murinocardiopsis flavida]
MARPGTPETALPGVPETARKVLIVGGSSAIAAAAARAFADTGAAVAGVALDPFDAPGYAATRAADCADPAQAADAVHWAHAELGGLDTVVPAAAVMPVAAAADTTDAQWRAAIDVTLGSAFATCRAALPLLPRGAAITMVGSVNATLAAPGLPGYAAAKGGVEALTRQLALEYGPRGIRVNAVAPGLIGGGDLPNAHEGYPLGRTGTPEEVAAAVVFLSSAAASFITGTVLPIDGGLSIASPAAFLRPDLRARFLPDAP